MTGWKLGLWYHRCSCNCFPFIPFYTTLFIYKVV